MSGSLTADVRRCLERHEGLTVVVTVGNEMRGDDGAGPYIASRVLPGGHRTVLDAGINPENVIDTVIGLRPSYLLVIDAADFGGYPGQARVIGEDEIPDHALSTHMFPISAVLKLIVQSIPVEIRTIGIQPLRCAFNEGLSEEVMRTADEIISSLNAEPF